MQFQQYRVITRYGLLCTKRSIVTRQTNFCSLGKYHATTEDLSVLHLFLKHFPILLENYQTSLISLMRHPNAYLPRNGLCGSYVDKKGGIKFLLVDISIRVDKILGWFLAPWTTTNSQNSLTLTIFSFLIDINCHLFYFSKVVCFRQTLLQKESSSLFC